jgi:hypothetical protein
LKQQQIRRQHPKMADSTSVKKKQCVWIVRYGLTKFPLVESVGPFDSK